jgi:hypothetical protein
MNVQDDQNSLCTWWLQYRKLQVMLNVALACLQTCIDTRLTLTPSDIPKSNYVIKVSDWDCLKYFRLFFYSNHQVHRDFLIAVHNDMVFTKSLKSKRQRPRSWCLSYWRHAESWRGS